MRETRAARVEQANTLLPYYNPGLSLEVRQGRLWLVYDAPPWPGDPPYHAARGAVLSRSGNSLACGYGALGMGGTCAAATAQLIRWIRDLPRLPLATWRYWCGPTVGLARPRGAEFLATLAATSYADPAKVSCVLCHDPTAPIVDWWSMPGGLTGPCCSHWGCLQREVR